MATDVERLVVSLSADFKSLEREMQKANNVAARQTRQLEKRFTDANRNITSTMDSLGSNIAGSLKASLGGVLAGVSLDQLKKFAGDYIGIINTLKVAGLQGAQLSAVFGQLYAIAQEQGQPIDALATLYGKAAAAQKELKTNSAELVQFTNFVAMALRVAGTDATKASGALLQLGQALGSAKVGAEEFNSINDSAKPILEAVAAGIEEAGGSVSKLKQLVNEGKVSNEAFYRGGLAGADTLKAKLADVAETVDQALTRMRNAFTLLFGTIDQAGGYTASFVAAMKQITDAMDAVGAKADRIKLVVDAFNKSLSIFNPTRVLGMLGAAEQQFYSNNRINPDGSPRRELEGPPIPFDKGGYGPVAPLPVAKKPISLKNFPVVGAKDKTDPSGGADKTDEYDRATKAIERRTIALGAEALAIGKSEFEAAKAAETFRLMEAAKQAGRENTPALRAEIEKLATAYATAKVAVEKLKDAQSAYNDALRFSGDLTLEVFDALISKGNAAEAVIKSLAKALAQAAIMGSGPLAGILGLKSEGGGVGGLLGFISSAIKGFADGGFTGSGGKYAPAGVVHRGEYVFDAASTKKLGVRNLEALRSASKRGFAEGGYVMPRAPTIPTISRSGGSSRGGGFTYAPVIDARGAQAGVADQIAASLKENNKQLLEYWNRNAGKITPESARRYGARR